MDPHQGRRAVLQIAHFERDHLLVLIARSIRKPEDAELPEATGKIRLGDLSKF
jgi:hypothetical protein